MVAHVFGMLYVKYFVVLLSQTGRIDLDYPLWDVECTGDKKCIKRIVWTYTGVRYTMRTPCSTSFYCKYGLSAIG